MRKFAPVTEDQLAAARRDPAVRHKLLAANLDMLLAELNKLQQLNSSDATKSRQIREGVALAVRLADLIRRVAQQRPASSSAVA